MFEPPPPEDDGLITPEVGPWSLDKHHYLRRYIDIFTTGMKNRPWRLHYIDLFAGAGIESVKGHSLDWGSPLLAAQAPVPFQQLHLCEKDAKKFSALKSRLKQFPQPQAPQVLRGDANAMCERIVDAIPRKATLSLALLDPYGLHLAFESVKVLARLKVDLIVFFPDRVDMLRNFGIYLEQPDSNLDRFMGTDAWRGISDDVTQGRWAEALQDLYIQQMAQIGFGHHDHLRIHRDDGVPLYKLIFFSRHERGAEFWRRISRKDAGGQLGFEY